MGLRTTYRAAPFERRVRRLTETDFMSNCKTCKWLDVPSDKNGRVTVRAHNTYRCTAPEPARPLIPCSMTEAYGWKWPTPRRYMGGKDGDGCPTYAYRDKTPNVEVTGLAPEQEVEK